MEDQKQPRQCNRDGCMNEAKYGICLSLKVHPHHEPAISSPMVEVCEEHKEVPWDDLVTVDGWQRILKGFTAIGRMPPNKTHSKLEAIPLDKCVTIGELEAKAMASGQKPDLGLGTQNN